MSGGEPFRIGPYLFVAAQDWLLAIGYPLAGADDPGGFDRALSAALNRTHARDVWAVAPALPERLQAHCRDRDHYYTLPLAAVLPARLERLAAPGIRSAAGGGRPHLHRGPPAPLGRVHRPGGPARQRARAVRPNRSRALPGPRVVPPERLGCKRPLGGLPAARLGPAPLSQLPHRRPLPHPLHGARLGPAFPGDDPGRPAAGQGVRASRPGGERRHPPLQNEVGRHPLAALRDGGVAGR